jgi:uncharacterized protein (TIGR02271 family)
MTDHHRSQSTPGDDDHDVSVIRHEEHLLVGTEVHATERVRLERYVVTERRTITVDVSREEVRLVREPVAGHPVLPADRTAETREPIVVVLREEQVDVVKRVVPVERVTLTVHTVTEDRPVEAVLRHEEVTTDRGPTRGTDQRH